MKNFEELNGLVKIKQPRKVLPEDATCYVCGQNKSECRLRSFNEYILCETHYQQLMNHGKITNPEPRKHKGELKTCCICGEMKFAAIDGKDYCRRHYIQMMRHGEIFRKTIYDKNEIIEYDDYIELILVDVHGNETGRTKIDKETYEKVKPYKVYMRNHGDKQYAMFSIKGSGRKVMLHRFLLGIGDENYSIDKVVDHINGDGLDNRLSNLRICSQHDNSKNNKGNGKIRGISLIKFYNGKDISKWNARIMFNYKTLHLGYFDTKEEAILARLKKEKELFTEYGPNKDLYYILDHPSPIEELTKVLSEGA